MQEEDISSSLFQLPQRVRGNHSLSFQDITIKTNHYRATMKPITKIAIFSMKFQPKIFKENTQLRNQILNNCFSQIQKNIKNPVISGMNIYSTKDSTEIQKQYVWKQHKIIVKRVKLMDLTVNPQMLLTFLNNNLRSIMRKLNYVEIGKSKKFFNPKEKVQFQNLMIYNGYQSNFVNLQKGYFLRVNPATKIVRCQTVLQYINKLYSENQQKDRQQKRGIVRSELMNKVVMASYGKGCYYKVIDVKYQELETLAFNSDREDKKNISFLEYYQEKYGIKIKNKKQPIIISEGNRKEEVLWLIPELLLMTGVPEDFDAKRRKNMAQKNMKQPKEKINQIQNLMNSLQNSEEIKTLQKIGIQLSKKMLEIQAKLIPPPVLQLGNNQKIDRGKEANFQLYNQPIYLSKHNIRLAVIYSKGTDIRQFLDVFESTSKKLAVNLVITKYQINFVNRMSLKDVQTSLETASRQKCNLCCLIIPSHLKNQYENIKIAAMMQEEMMTQLFLEQKLKNKGIQSIATKALLQIIAKGGNVLWISNPTRKTKETMLVAFQTSKCLSNKIVLSLVSFINSSFNSIYSKTVLYQGSQKKYQNMLELLILALNAYVQRNKKIPQEIVIFQNSCSADQNKLYFELFVQPFNTKISQIYGSIIPMILVGINTRPNQRFFSNEGNVSAGTLISKDLVSNNYDFYIVSQESHRGSSLPCHYQVIYSSSTTEEAILQELAFTQCYNYMNWTGSIKIPSILQYARKCAKFHSEVIKDREIPESFTRRMYFI